MIWVSFSEYMPGISCGIRTKFVSGTYIIVPKARARIVENVAFVEFIRAMAIIVVRMPDIFRVGTLFVDFFATIIDRRVPIRAPVVNRVEILLAGIGEKLVFGKIFSMTIYRVKWPKYMVGMIMAIFSLKASFRLKSRPSLVFVDEISKFSPNISQRAKIIKDTIAKATKAHLPSPNNFMIGPIRRRARIDPTL